jgi:hypothetical protein
VNGAYFMGSSDKTATAAPTAGRPVAHAIVLTRPAIRRAPEPEQDPVYETLAAVGKVTWNLAKTVGEGALLVAKVVGELSDSSRDGASQSADPGMFYVPFDA